MDLLALLAERGVIKDSDAESLASEATERNLSVEMLLREKGINPAAIMEAKAIQANVEYYPKIEPEKVKELSRFIGQKLQTQYRALPLDIVEGVLRVGMVDPNDPDARDAIQFIVSKHQLPYKFYLISEDDFNEVIDINAGLTDQVTDALAEFNAEEEQTKDLEEETLDLKSSDGMRAIEDAPVTKIVATIIHYATEGRASDVHIEPMDGKTRVRFRVDGSLHTSLTLPGAVQNAIVARIKILSKLRLDEKRKPQDGRFSAFIGGRKIDFRVSTLPTYFGEKVVIRILDSARGVIALEKLGMRERDFSVIKEAISRPYGMILISGPTGSGKSTTLYSMLNELDKETQNVLSLEDPVEYNMEGIAQSQMRPEIGYTFASGLRTALRQDPDVIMVGEIRDRETAQLAIQAALTGHLVLSTIHTNTAAGVVPRLVDMGVDPYLIAPTLIMAIGQRLAKRLCEGTGEPMSVTGSTQMMVERYMEDIPPEMRAEIAVPDQVYRAQASDECPSGTRGRLACFEVLRVTPEVEQVILTDATEQSIMKLARNDGMLTMREDALLKAFNGKIPFEEVNKL